MNRLSLLLASALAACGGTVIGTGGQGGSGGSGGSGASGCATDADCAFGAEWCVHGECVPCDDGAALCDILCADGWSTYERNGCSPCACAPINE